MKILRLKNMFNWSKQLNTQFFYINLNTQQNDDNYKVQYTYTS